jgi:hypothetical protein
MTINCIATICHCLRANFFYILQNTVNPQTLCPIFPTMSMSQELVTTRRSTLANLPCLPWASGCILEPGTMTSWVSREIRDTTVAPTALVNLSHSSSIIFLYFELRPLLAPWTAMRTACSTATLIQNTWLTSFPTSNLVSNPLTTLLVLKKPLAPYIWAILSSIG